MLKLKRVEIQGFKSFCERAEMKFHGAGIAAVVGPNGCGKSNLSDAISWVLGEQSAKSLRGSRMEDVIFAGSRDRKPLGMASVTMTLVDPKALEAPAAPAGAGEAPADGPANPLREAKAQEMTITRRLYRSGDSEYLINGRTARLRDIQDLFMGTGLGPESYAIIEQGRIGQILSTKPQDRRGVIEEAAGITRFKNKRRLAEAKLESAKQNLTRVFDILEEVTRQVNSLRRQAAKARRYDELKAELVENLRVALTGRFRHLEREATKTALDLNLATQSFQTLSERLQAREAEHAQFQEACFQVEGELTEARKRLAEQRVEAERTRSRLEFQTKQVAGIEQRLVKDEAESGQLSVRVHQLQAEQDTQRERLAELEQQTESARARLAAKEQERNRLQAALREHERAMESGRQHILRLMGETSTLKNQLAQVSEYLAGVDRDTARSQREEEAAASDTKRLQESKTELAERLRARQLELALVADQRRDVDQQLFSRRSLISETRRQLDQLRAEASRLRARRDSLEEILSHHSYATGAVKRLFTAIEKGQVRDLTLAGVLADFMDVDARCEKAVEEYLREELEYLVVADWAQAERGLELMRGELEGRATFFIVPDAAQLGTVAPFISPQLEKQAGVVGRLSDLLRLTGKLAGLPPALLPRIANCYVMEDRETAQRLAPGFPEVYLLALDGACYQGYSLTGGKKSGSGPLGLKRESRELAAALETKQAEVERTGQQLEALEDQVNSLGEELERLRALQQHQEKDAHTLEVEMRKLTEESSRANSRLSVARLELNRLRQQAEKSRDQRDNLQDSLEQKEEARLRQEEAVTTAREQVETQQAEAIRASEEHAGLRVELAEAEERRRAERAAQARLETQLREATQRAQALSQELEKLTQDRSRLKHENVELDARAHELTTDITALEQTVDRLAEREQVSRSRLAAHEEALKRLRPEWQGAQERRSQLEVQLVRSQAALQYLQETCQKELQTTLEELAEGVEVIPPEEAIAEAEQKYQEMRQKIDALGPVNTQALEEFQEAQQRLDFLTAQRQDLLDSIRDTERAIHEIDVESRKRFTEAFHAINAHFREMFKTLFSGGTGEMRLTDEENVIESGIEIVAQPPSKKLQNVLLLSGGEKALTAMALLMAIFKYQPSPFCILDEVDAPLDEPNIERMTRLLKEMADQTQFIVITHAKRTMESAEALYGVTMQEPGVSKLVSVKFTPLEQAPLPPPSLPPASVEAANAQ